MKIRLWTGALVGAAALAAPMAQAGEPQGVCQAPAHRGDPLLGRSERIARYEGLGEQCLKALVVSCTDSAGRQLMDTGDAFACSIGYEALLRGHFKGDFGALLDWWRGRRGALAPE